MTKYKISMTLTAEEFMTIFPRIGADVQLEIKKIDLPVVTKELREPRVRSPAPEGKLSVNGAIKQRLEHGYATIGELKDALVGAGKSAASLSTGIAALTKAGEIERTGDGMYALKAA